MSNEQTLGRFRPKLIAIAVASCFVADAALANPTGHTVVHGNVTVKEVGNLLKIHNSPNAVINWQSFSIGANEITKFIQQSRNSVVMNRVVGSNGLVPASEILGSLKSNGKVYLLNSSGVVFGAGSTVDVAGLVASSLKLSDSDFHANRLRFTDGADAGKVENHGNITTGRGGEVYLVGSAVTNGGVITSPKGNVVLAAGKQVELVNPGTPNLRVEVNAPDNKVLNLGHIVAESGRIGIYAGLINNSGTIRADSAVAEGGRILLKATKDVTLESSSILDASGQGGGTIEVHGGKSNGTVNVAGRLDASAPVNGDGGFIETSAADVNVAAGTVITTSALNGQTGTWLVDPTNYRIAAYGYGGDITGATLSSQLGSTNVQLTSDMGATPGLGDVIVDDMVSWSSGNSLTLIARNNVDVNQSIINTGTGGINIFAGWDGSSTSNPVVNPGTGSIFLDNSVQTGGQMRLIAGNQVSQNIGSIVANELLAMGGSGGVYLWSGSNQIGTVAGRAGGSFYLYNSTDLTVGTVGGVSGITVEGSTAYVNLQTGISPTAGITVNKDIRANATSGGGSIYLDANGDIKVRNATVSAAGGDGFEGSYVQMYGRFVSIDNSTVEAKAQGSGQANLDLYAFGSQGVTVRNSTLRANTADGGANIDIATGISGGNVVVEDSTVIAKGRSAEIFAYGGGVTIRSSTMTATGDKNAAYGGNAGIGLFAANGIDTTNSSLSAFGSTQSSPPAAKALATEVPIPAYGGGISVLAEQGDVKLGLLSTNGIVQVVSQTGKIVDGNVGGNNIAAPGAFLFGAGGVGTLANPLETQVGSLFIGAESGQVGIANLGNLRLEALSFGGSDAAIGTTGTLTLGTPVSVPGNLALGANVDLDLDKNVSAGGDLFLQALGNLKIHGASVSGHNVDLVGNNILIGSDSETAPTSVIASHMVRGNSALNFNVTGGANSSASSVVRGEDVDLTVGGVININGGAAYAQIEATTPDTIMVTFPNRTAGGFFVNGNEGVVSDGSTGFFAAGEPAVLGQSLKVTYGGANPIITENNNQVLDGMNNAGDAPEITTLSDPNAPEGQKDKSLPVCK